MGPYQATGSPIGLPDTSRNRTGSSSVVIDNAVAVAVKDEVLRPAQAFPLHVEVVPSRSTS